MGLFVNGLIFKERDALIPAEVAGVEYVPGGRQQLSGLDAHLKYVGVFEPHSGLLGVSINEEDIHFGEQALVE